MSNMLTIERNTSKSASAIAAEAVSGAYAFVVAALSSLMRPQAESPAEAANRLRMLASQYADSQPSYAADLRAAADHAQGE